MRFPVMDALIIGTKYQHKKKKKKRKARERAVYRVVLDHI